MTFSSGTVAASPTATNDFVLGALHNALVANGFTFIDSVTYATSYTSRAYKSAQAGNGVTDWYLIVSVNGDSVALGVAEGYDTTAHVPVAAAYSPYQATEMVAVKADGTRDFTFSTSWPSLFTQYSYSYKALTSAGGFSWWLSVNPERVVLATRVISSDYCAYAGLFDDWLGSGLQPKPLMFGGPGASTGYSQASSSAGGATRQPGISVAGSVAGVLGRYCSSSAYTPNSADMLNLITGKYTAYPLTVHDARRVSGSILGALKDALQLRVTAVNGDTLTYEGRQYVCMKTGSIDAFFDTTA